MASWLCAIARSQNNGRAPVFVARLQLGLVRFWPLPSNAPIYRYQLDMILGQQVHKQLWRLVKRRVGLADIRQADTARLPACVQCPHLFHRGPG